MPETPNDSSQNHQQIIDTVITKEKPDETDDMSQGSAGSSTTFLSVSASQTSSTTTVTNSFTSPNSSYQSFENLNEVMEDTMSSTSSFSNFSSTNIDPIRRNKKLTRNVQSYLQATDTARNFVYHNPALYSIRLKRLATSNQKNKSSKSPVKRFETKNLLLRSLMEKYDKSKTLQQWYFDLQSMEKKTRIPKNNYKKLLNLFSKYECYYTTALMVDADNFDIDSKFTTFKKNHNLNEFQDNEPSETSTEPLADTIDESNTESLSVKQNPTEFFTCPLCTHCLFEPITLICGCTYCKNCLLEYNALSLKLNTTKELKKISEATTGINGNQSSFDNTMLEFIGMESRCNDWILKKPEYECFNCGKKHGKNTPSHLKVNTLISLLVDKLWTPNVEIKRLRNEIRNYVVFGLENNEHFNLEKYEYLFNQAYEKDPSNHLLLVDLFLLNHFSGHYEKSMKYAEQVVELKSSWVFGHFLKAIAYEKLGDINGLKTSLAMCLKLDPSLEYIKSKLKKIEKCHEIIDKSPFSKYARRRNKKRAADDSLVHSRVDTDVAGCIQKLPSRKKLLKLAPDNLDDLVNNKTLDLNRQINNSTLLNITSNNALSEPANSSEQKRRKSIDLFESKSSQSPILIKKTASEQSFHDACPEMATSKANESADPCDQLTSSDLSKESSIDISDTSINMDQVDNREPAEQINIHQFKSYENLTKFYVDPKLIKNTDVECSLCYRVLYKPVSTPCGHTYCSSCLDRSLDHQDKCPLCKSSLDEYLAERRHNTTSFLEQMIKDVFVNEFAEREKQHIEELHELTNDENEIPIFVCTLALPFAPCPLHIYEPRYRLMLRRAIETDTRQFGMCMYGESTPYRFTEYGCMLEIRNYQFTRDGRAVVATVGGRRFRVMKVSNKDGYYVAKIQWVSDKRVEDEQEKSQLQALHDEVYQLSLNWYSLIPLPQKKKIRDIYGINDMPEPDEDIQSNDNGPVWHWFLLNILPLENDFQYRFLTKSSLKERLKQLKRILLVLMTPRGNQSPTSTQPSNQASSSTEIVNRDETGERPEQNQNNTQSSAS